jgi:hypothetical protein
MLTLASCASLPKKGSNFFEVRGRSKMDGLWKITKMSCDGKDLYTPTPDPYWQETLFSTALINGDHITQLFSNVLKADKGKGEISRHCSYVDEASLHRIEPDLYQVTSESFVLRGDAECVTPSLASLDKRTWKILRPTSHQFEVESTNRPGCPGKLWMLFKQLQ